MILKKCVLVHRPLQVEQHQHLRCMPNRVKSHMIDQQLENANGKHILHILYFPLVQYFKYLLSTLEKHFQCLQALAMGFKQKSI